MYDNVQSEGRERIAQLAAERRARHKNELSKDEDDNDQDDDGDVAVRYSE